MIKEPKNILLKVLVIIGFTDDKEEFVEKFFKNIYLQSIADLIRSQSSVNQKKIKEELSKNQSDPLKTDVVLKTYFSEDDIKKALENAAKKAMVDYIQTIDPALSNEQRSNLNKLFLELKAPV